MGDAPRRHFQTRSGRCESAPLFHTLLALLLQQGVSSKTVAERLGHSTMAITLDTYSHLTPGVKEDAANKFEEALRQAEILASGTVG